MLLLRLLYLYFKLFLHIPLSRRVLNTTVLAKEDGTVKGETSAQSPVASVLG